MQLKQLIIPQSYFKDIYSSSSKILISSLDKPIFLKILNNVRQIKVYEFKYDQQSQKGIISLIEKPNDNSNLVEMALAPNFCLGMVVFSEAAKEELVELARWWSAKSSESSVPPLIKLNPQQESALQAEFWQHMYARMAQQTHAIARRVGTLQKQYLGLRTIHENMQNAFATIEDYLSQAKLPSLQLVFENKPTKKLEPSQINDSNSSIKQLLPVASRGIAVVELHVAKTNRNAVGYLTVQLKACEDDTSFAMWQVPYPELTQGWLGLDLPTIDIGRKRDVELVVEWNTDIGPTPSLSLGAVQPIPEVRAYSHEVTLDHSLAFRVWNGLPGTRKVTSPYLVSERSRLVTKGMTQTASTKKVVPANLGYLGQGAMAKVKQVTPNLPTETFDHIQVIDHGAKIMTHPRANGSPTIAMLPFSFPTEANYLTATVITEHEKADLIEYALAIITNDTELKNCLKEEYTLAHSGWISIEPNTQSQISVYLDHLLEENCHIVIAARLAPNSHPDYAWCRWINFYLGSDSRNIKDNLQQGPISQQIKTIGRQNASLDLSEENFSQVPSR